MFLTLHHICFLQHVPVVVVLELISFLNLQHVSLIGNVMGPLERILALVGHRTNGITALLTIVYDTV